MIDHLGLDVRDIARATEFYLKALAPLGYGVVMQVSAEERGGSPAVGFGPPGKAEDFQSGKPSFWIAKGEPQSGPMHVAFVAESRAAVDAFFDQVMVMTDDVRVRTNRLALLAALQRLFLHIANLSRLPGV